MELRTIYKQSWKLREDVSKALEMGAKPGEIGWYRDRYEGFRNAISRLIADSYEFVPYVHHENTVLKEVYLALNQMITFLEAELEKRPESIELAEKERQKLDQILSILETKERESIEFIESSPEMRNFEDKIKTILAEAPKSEWAKIEGQGITDIFITGYFDQDLMPQLIDLMKTKGTNIKILSPELKGTHQDRINRKALEELQKAGGQIKTHSMLHARMFVTNTDAIVGSMDVKSDCLGGRRFDVGIWTKNPVVVKSSIEFFEKIWEDAEPL